MFVLVDEGGKMGWIRDYGASPEHGSIMYVFPRALLHDMPSV
jgi:hypothetical protein